MNVRQFALPDLGEGLVDAEIVRWLVEVGDAVEVDQPVIEVETAKAAIEVPVPYAGVVTALHGEAGSTINVGAPLLSVASAGLSEPGVETSPNLVGSGVTKRARRQGRRRALAVADAVAPPVSQVAVAPESGPVAVVSPVVRKLARENHVDLKALAGSGPDGLVLRKDVVAAISGQAEDTQVEGQTRIPLRGVRGMVADRLSRSRREIPEATVWVDVDATGLLAARQEINSADPARPVSLLALIARFCVLGLKRYPALNSTVDTERGEIVISDAVNLGFAAQTPRGLVVPVVKDAQDLTTRELAAQLGHLTESVRDGSLPPAKLTGGTFTVNNYGVFGVDGSAAIINYPEAAIVGIGRIIDRPWVVDGQLAVRKVTELTLAFDHRVCDGEVAGGFLRFLADCVERPTALLGDL
ncbi:dihydrolipoamide acetyltransferase family protein [Kibdelosporangium phytohabitans]|uniref:Dihydrolipoamide acetyltransferase component of pyruvate dehydrogenase complex n=1 Tax=Kibdelosporangium phytohabitans TaxID=860235 RepID=A0A0N9HUJ5_9PSEU|nr:dihydrolipoamide acetyltransferase family protein [Kibdelosporangium phytohabitans]ALG07203.1 branched-chain alpha-keto acid dehydrogenase subunit E2 [Kibdelosporangium phytohabitans]MBE1471949.1 pyruvate dehydrogenase E2 component (dihydrolipoamide acetyltransferase) [Kibdelosporangium phytohabitans]